MPVERELGCVIRSTLTLSGTERMKCYIVSGDESGDLYVAFSGESYAGAVYKDNPASVADAITWAEDFLSMLRRL